MIDIDLIRNAPAKVKKNLKRRGMNEQIEWIEKLQKKDEEWRGLKGMIDQLRAKRNRISKDINEAKKAGKSVKNVIAKAKKIPQEIEKKELKAENIRKEINYHMMRIPNMLHESVPTGKSEDENVELRKNGKTTKFSFELKNHVELCEALDIADFDRSAKIAGHGFYFLKNELVLLEQALIRFALDILHKKGFTLMTTPHMMRKQPYEGVCDYGTFEDVLYKVEDEDEHLIATSEHPLTAQFMDEIIEEEHLPMTLAGVSTCFRKEAGGHGVDEKGLFRVHQFTKVEQVVLCQAGDSEKWHEKLLGAAEEIFKALKLSYRVVTLCSADTGVVAAKTYDLELWMPRTKKYREAVSCSNCTDYQARRLKIRHRTMEGTKLVHTLNSTAIATTRTMVAILENFQQKDGSVKIPKVLWPYMNDVRIIGKK
jgi:seryl-tRNA synthetase